jgi:hypothetical protein
MRRKSHGNSTLAEMLECDAPASSSPKKPRKPRKAIWEDPASDGEVTETEASPPTTPSTSKQSNDTDIEGSEMDSITAEEDYVPSDNDDDNAESSVMVQTEPRARQAVRSARKAPVIRKRREIKYTVQKERSELIARRQHDEGLPIHKLDEARSTFAKTKKLPEFVFPSSDLQGKQWQMILLCNQKGQITSQSFKTEMIIQSWDKHWSFWTANLRQEPVRHILKEFKGVHGHTKYKAWMGPAEKYSYPNHGIPVGGGGMVNWADIDLSTSDDDTQPQKSRKKHHASHGFDEEDAGGQIISASRTSSTTPHSPVSAKEHFVVSFKIKSATLRALEHTGKALPPNEEVRLRQDSELTDFNPDTDDLSELRRSALDSFKPVNSENKPILNAVSASIHESRPGLTHAHPEPIAHEPKKDSEERQVVIDLSTSPEASIKAEPDEHLPSPPFSNRPAPPAIPTPLASASSILSPYQQSNTVMVTTLDPYTYSLSISLSHLDSFTISHLFVTLEREWDLEDTEKQIRMILVKFPWMTSTGEAGGKGKDTIAVRAGVIASWADMVERVGGAPCWAQGESCRLEVDIKVGVRR